MCIRDRTTGAALEGAAAALATDAVLEGAAAELSTDAASEGAAVALSTEAAMDGASLSNDAMARSAWSTLSKVSDSRSSSKARGLMASCGLSGLADQAEPAGATLSIEVARPSGGSGLDSSG